jgi:hypothetical protein
MTNRVVVPASQAGNLFLGSLKGFKIRAQIWSACVYLPLGAEGPDGFLRESEEGGAGAQQKDGGAQARVHRKEHQPEVGSQARPQEGDEACNMLKRIRFRSLNTSRYKESWLKSYYGMLRHWTGLEIK